MGYFGVVCSAFHHLITGPNSSEKNTPILTTLTWKQWLCNAKMMFWAASPTTSFLKDFNAISEMLQLNT